jgi:NTP pyrophosphatase (non-canonical NTP hydrolase)
MTKLQLRDNPTLQDLQEYVAAAMKVRGFDTEDIPRRFMMLLEEAGEFAKAARTTVGLKFASDTQTKELEEEAADVLIILLGLCNMLDIDLEQAFRQKEARNKKRTWK